MATSPIYSWPEPDNTDLVKNGALAIRTLGNAIDTTMGTMVAKTVVDAKGDLIAGTAADTVNRLAVGNNGETLVADSSTSTGLRYQATQAAGKNYIINGGFDIWQRGTSTSGNAYGADRWYGLLAAGTGTFAQSTATPVVSGSQYFTRFTASAGSTSAYLEQAIEQAMVIPLRGQAMVLSGYLRGSFTGNVAFNVLYSNSTDARASVSTSVTTSYSTTAITSSFVRFTATFTVPTDAVGLKLQIGSSGTPIGNTQTFDWSNFQLEVGSVPTQFTRAGGTIQGELAACQRYYWRGGNGAYSTYGTGFGISATVTTMMCPLPVEMRVPPTTVDFSNICLVDNATRTAITSIALSLYCAKTTGAVEATVGSSVLTTNRFYFIQNNNNAAGYIGFSAEL